MAILDITTYAGPYPSGWGLLDDDAQTINDADTSTLPQARITALKMYETAGAAGGVTDDDAIHDNVASEISAITEKVTPVSADLLVIEDSAAANAKKRVQVGNLPSGGGGGGSVLRCRATMIADETAADYTTLTAIAFDKEDFDEGGWHDTVTNNERVTVPASAKDEVDVTAYVRVSSFTSNLYAFVQVYKDGAFYKAIESESGLSQSHLNIHLPNEVVVPGTTYFELRLQIETDTSVTVHKETNITISESIQTHGA